VNKSSFKEVKIDNEENLTLSTLGIGTLNEEYQCYGDFWQYNSIKYALLSGGMNFIDTGSHFRAQRGELMTGLALRTLFEKFGMQRNEVFVSSK